MVIAVGFRVVHVIRLFKIGALCIGFRLCFGGGDWSSIRYVVLVIRGIDVTSLSNALDQANAHLRAAGLTDQMVIGK